MKGFDYTFSTHPAKRIGQFRSALELNWFKYLKPRVSYISYELMKIYPSTPTWQWSDQNSSDIYVTDFFAKTSYDPTYHVIEVKPISDLSQFLDYLPKPKNPSHRLYLFGTPAGSGPVWRWIDGSWVPYPNWP